ncbi:MAG: flagellar hook-length control protein FliK [Epsilonproteobacteria bacterium]|nr:flagellar hook-length control protein FliK [Campylobacterota bacterium]
MSTTVLPIFEDLQLQSTNSSNKGDFNFISTLLKGLDEKEGLELLKSLNISPEDLEKLINNTTDEEDKSLLEKYLKLLKTQQSNQQTLPIKNEKTNTNSTNHPYNTEPLTQEKNTAQTQTQTIQKEQTIQQNNQNSQQHDQNTKTQNSPALKQTSTDSENKIVTSLEALLKEVEDEIEHTKDDINTLLKSLSNSYSKEDEIKAKSLMPITPQIEDILDKIDDDMENIDNSLQKIVLNIQQNPNTDLKNKIFIEQNNTKLSSSTTALLKIDNTKELLIKITKTRLPSIDTKDVTSLKDIVKFAADKDLNLSKITVEISKELLSGFDEIKESVKKGIKDFFANLSKNIEEKNTKNENQNIQTQQNQLANITQIQKKEFFPKPKFIPTQNSKKDIHTPKKEPAEKHVSLESLLSPKTQKKEKKQNSNQQNQQHQNSHINQPSQNIINELKANIAQAKESIRHFSNNLKDAIENYKPPVSKISLEMNPQELGKVEVTLIKRGDNLQIQINSNNQAVNFLHSQQQELRQSLVNMGFSQVNMSFNSNSNQKEQQQYQQNQQLNNTNEEEDELIIEIPYYYA